MENEKLKIFDENRNHIGEATRAEVHRLGLRHEAFHCWFVEETNNQAYIYFQIRSELKKDYPNLLDITAAGHLLSHETVDDGVREIEEEIGIHLSINELFPLGVIEYCFTEENFIDNEMAHVFIYKSNYSFNDFTLQEEEVSGIVRVELSSFTNLLNGDNDVVQIEGYRDNKPIFEKVTLAHFAPYEQSYYERVLSGITAYLNG